MHHSENYSLSLQICNGVGVCECGVCVCDEHSSYKGPTCEECPVSVILIFEPPHDKTNKIAYAPSEDSDQPGHPPRLI